MSIENPEEYVKNLWDWRILDNCFGESNISVSDLDGFVERNGNILILETKSPTVKMIPKGQEIAFNSFIKTGIITVFVIWGWPGKPEFMQIWPKKVFNCDIKSLRDYVKRWYHWADTGKKL